MQHYTIVVYGKVQGVFFRASTREQAQQLDIRGWVKNEADGSVRIEAEGEAAALQRLVAWCHQGPPPAQVTTVDVRSGEVVNYTEFEVRR